MNKMVEMGLFINWGNTGTHNLEPKNDTIPGRWGAFLGGKKGTNTDYRGAVGTIFEGMQFVYDSKGRLVVDSINKGSFDFSSPDVNAPLHYFLDVDPWFKWGNGPDDILGDVLMTNEQWSQIDAIYERFKGGEINKEQAAREVQRVLPPPPIPRID